MFKSRIPLQTPIVVKLILFTTLGIFFARWSVSSNTYSVESPAQTGTISMFESDR